MRYEHWLPTAKPGPWPDAALCVSTSVRWTALDCNSVREYATLDSWNVQLCVRHGSGYAIGRTANGTTVESFWDALRIASLRCRNLWVISSHFREEASVLGLWDRMESGRVRIAGSEGRRERHTGGGVSDLPPAGNPAMVASTAEVDGNNVRGVRELLDTESQLPRNARKSRRKPVSGVCILEDPPIVLSLMIDVGGSKITWVDAANYGLDLSSPSLDGAGTALALADWFLHAASALQSLGRCGWSATAGSQAMHLFRSVYHETPILCHTSGHATSLERAALFGGRCEPFSLGKVAGPVHLYDFRSMYPYLYTTAAVPVRLVSTVQRLSMAEILEDDSSHYWIAKVDIETDTPEYPYRAEHETIYPVGRYTTVLAGPELVHAIRQKAIRIVRSAARYESECALGGYAKALYQIREQADRSGDIPLSEWTKRLMNCLHGKFAQREASWEEMPDAECPWEWAEWYERVGNGEFQRWRCIAGACSREIKGGFSHGTVPAIAAAVSAAGRDRLRRAIDCAGWASVHYCDTDSIIVDDYGSECLALAGLVRPGEWGYLQHVVSAEECGIYGVKHYRIGDRIRESGVQRDGSLTGHPTVDTASQPGIREQFRAKLAPANWRESHPYQRGPGRYDALREPGGRVKPMFVDEWEP
jgi:hypothetical protein